MIETWTLPLENNIAKQLIDSIYMTKNFKSANRYERIKFDSKQLPNLDSYEFKEGPINTVDIEFCFDIKKIENFKNFKLLLSRLLEFNESLTCFAEMNETPMPRDRDAWDHLIHFGYVEGKIPFIRFTIGKNSSSYGNPIKKKQNYERYIKTIGCQDSLKIILNNNSFSLITEKKFIAGYKSWNTIEIKQLIDHGNVYVMTNVVDEKMSKPNKLDSIALYGVKIEKLLEMIESLITNYDDYFTYFSRVIVSTKPSEYQNAKMLLKELSISGSWRISFRGRSRYDVKNIDEFVSTLKSFSTVIGWMNVKGVGDVVVNLFYDEKRFVFQFAYEPLSDTNVHLLVENTVIGLAGGKDIVDRTHT